MGAVSPRERMEVMDIKEIETLIKLVSGSELTEFELEEGNMKVTLKKEKAVQTLSAPAPLSAVGTASAPAAPSAEVPLFGEPDEVVTAPLVGTFYSAPAEDGAPFVRVGDPVKKGQVVGIVEAMKLMNEIECEYDGVVAAVLVENKQVVEYGQPLFRIAKQG